MINSGPICSVCTRDWDEHLGYCDYCDTIDAETDSRNRRRHSNTPVFDQLTLDLKIKPLRNNANTPGLWEDNFS